MKFKILDKNYKTMWRGGRELGKGRFEYVDFVENIELNWFDQIVRFVA